MGSDVWIAARGAWPRKTPKWHPTSALRFSRPIVVQYGDLVSGGGVCRVEGRFGGLEVRVTCEERR